MTNKKEKQELNNRPPVVVVLGHVDHGKTTLLDAIRGTRVVEKESGGITQHIGAYQIEYNGKIITFIDTPGHEAFSAMRSRGANVADIAILVVAADEGIKPQTKEAIDIIKNTNIPFIVAINKIDKPGADPNKVKAELAELEIFVESWGGKIPSVEISAKQKKGIEDLLEIILLVAEMENFKCDLNTNGKGVVIESYLDNKRGNTATILIKEGIVKIGDVVVCGSSFGKIKTMENFKKERIAEATPSMPIVITGLNKLPKLGEICEVIKDIQEAERKAQSNEQEIKNLDNFLIGKLQDKTKILNLILKVDFMGSAEAIIEALKKINLTENNLAIKFIKIGVGEIEESDIKYAISAKAEVIGFRIKIPPQIANFAQQKKITVANFDVIYELIEAVRNKLRALLETDVIKHYAGRLKILAIFKEEQNHSIIGGEIIEGRIKNGMSVDIIRNEKNLGSGVIENLEHNKIKIDAAEKGQLCGLLIKAPIKMKKDDILEIYEKEIIKKEI